MWTGHQVHPACTHFKLMCAPFTNFLAWMVPNPCPRICLVPAFCVGASIVQIHVPVFSEGYDLQPLHFDRIEM